MVRGQEHLAQRRHSNGALLARLLDPQALQALIQRPESVRECPGTMSALLSSPAQGPTDWA